MERKVASSLDPLLKTRALGMTHLRLEEAVPFVTPRHWLLVIQDFCELCTTRHLISSATT